MMPRSRRLVAFLPIIAACLYTAAVRGASSDPYAKDLEATMQQQANDVLDEATKLSFAAQCQVIDKGSAAAVSQLDAMQIIKGSGGVLNGDFFGLVHDAERSGVIKGQRDGCAYWHAHPDQVLAVRQYVAAGIQAESIPLR